MSQKNTTRARRRKMGKHRDRAYRKLVINYNIIATLLIILGVLYCASHIFTKKRSYRETGVELYNQGNYTEAIEYFDKALQTNQFFSDNVDADVLMYKASAYLNMQNYTSAKYCYETLLADYSDKYYDRNEYTFLVRLCDALNEYSNQNYVACLEVLKEACERGYYELSLPVATCYENISENDSLDKWVYMKTYLDVYAGRCTPNAYMYYKYAVYYLNIEDYSNAIDNIKLSLSYNDEEYKQELMYMLIMSYIKINDFDNASLNCEEYISLYPQDTRAQELLDYIYSRQHPDTEVINDIFGVNHPEQNESYGEEIID